MKKILNEKHDLIDKMAVRLFLYSSFVLFLLRLTSFVNNDVLRALFVLLLPVFFLCPKIVNWVNSWIHRVFGFNK